MNLKVVSTARSVTLTATIDLDPEDYPRIKEARSWFEIHTVDVEFRGETHEDALYGDDTIPSVRAIKGRRIKADGTLGAPIGNLHWLHQYNTQAETYDQIVATARAVLR